MKTALAIAALAAAVSKLPRTAEALGLVSGPENLFAQEDTFAALVANCDGSPECAAEITDYCMRETSLADADACLHAGLTLWEQCAE